MTDMILQSMGPAPSADLVGSILGVDATEDFQKLRPSSRKTEAPQPPPQQQSTTKKATADEDAPMQIVWRNIIIFIYLHAAALYGFYLCFTAAKWATVFWALFLHLYGGFGITGGAHRLWAHKAYKAKWPIRLFLAIAQTIAVQNSIYEWSRDHRVHHKFSETHADPHNANRGFFFSHMGWLLVRKHPEVKRRGKTVDMSDLLRDPIVVYQQKFYVPLVLILAFFMPAWVAWYYWDESFKTAFFVASMFRYCFTLHITWLVNSAAHIWGNHPYDNTINPAENLCVGFLTSGEGWHNYHHTFPWDYKAAELGNYRVNMTTAAIDFFAYMGWTYDLKTVPESVIRKRVLRTGDGSHRWHKVNGCPPEMEEVDFEHYTQHWLGEKSE